MPEVCRAVRADLAGSDRAQNRIIPPFLDHAETYGLTRALISDLG